MNGTEMIRAALEATGKTQRELAEHMEWSPQNLSGRLKNNSLTFDEMAKALQFCGYEVKMVDTSGRAIPNIGNSESPRICQMVDGKVYDTRKAESLCTNKVEQNGDFYIELFRDASGEFFFGLYTLWDGGHNSISPAATNVARRFLEQYGEGGREDDM